MTITTNASTDGRELVIKVEGRFDFKSFEEFSSTYENCSINPKSYKVDMSTTSYLDSSALGMLMCLKDHANKHHAEIGIVNCSNDAKAVLSTAHFETLFDIQ